MGDQPPRFHGPPARYLIDGGGVVLNLRQRRGHAEVSQGAHHRANLMRVAERLHGLVIGMQRHFTARV